MVLEEETGWEMPRPWNGDAAGLTGSAWRGRSRKCSAWMGSMPGCSPFAKVGTAARLYGEARHGGERAGN